MGSMGFGSPGNLTTRGGVATGLGQQYGINQGLMGQQNTLRNTESGAALGGYQSLLNSGYSDQEKSAINQGTTGAISQSYGDAATAAGRHAAATGSSAGFGSTVSSLARNKGKDVAAQQGQNEANFANQAYTRKLAGLSGISSLYGVDTSFLNSLGSQQNQLLGIGNSNNPQRKGILGDVQAAGSAVSSFI